MKKIYIPSSGPDSWKQFLADPEAQWKTGYSAKALAHSWEQAEGFPYEISRALSKLGFTLQEVLLSIPEYKVDLPGGNAASQNDLFILARLNNRLAVIMVEGKVDEPFGETISSWNPYSSIGRRELLDHLKHTLGLEDDPPADIRYPLLHRCASPIMEAKRFNAEIAMMLIHSFSQEAAHFGDYKKFLALFGKYPVINKIDLIRSYGGVDLYSGWVVGNEKYLGA